MNGVARRIGDARPQTRVAVTGTIAAADTITIGGSASYRCTLADGTGELDVIFLGWPTVAGLTPGTRCAVEATAGCRGSRLVLWNPRYRLVPPDGAVHFPGSGVLGSITLRRGPGHRTRHLEGAR